MLLQHFLPVRGGQFPPESGGQFRAEQVVSFRRNQVVNISEFSIAAPTGAPFYENTYPLSYSPGAQGKYQFDRDRFPKVYGDPVTAIEAPWRMLVSPQLNDPRQFRFKWIFTHSAADQSSRAELWMAILTVEPRPVIYPHSRVIGDEKIFQDVNDDFFSNLNLMFIGSPDHPVPSDAADKYFMTSPGVNAKVNILPHASDRYALVQLYIKYKLLARTSNLSFSQLGIGAYIEFKNTKVSVTTLQTPQIILNSYKHLISFGRDEAVEVTYLMLDKETGLKMLLIKTTKRRTKGGESYLDYREYIKPLDPEKDYTSHADDKGISKFRAPFKKIKFLELDPKRICGVNSGVYNNTNSNLSIPLSGGTDPEGCFYPITSDAKGNQRFLTFYMEITDWHDQVHRIHKKIQAVTFGTNARLANPADLTLDKIDAVFDSDSTGAELSAAELEKTNQDIDTNFVALVNSVKTFAEGAGGQGEHTFFDETVIQLTEIKNLLPGGQLGELINTRKNLFLNLLAAKENEFKRVVQQKIDTISLDVTNYKTRFSQKVIDLRADAAAVQVKIDDIVAGAKAEADLLTADLNTQLKALSIRAGKVKEMLNEFFTLNDSNNDAEDQLSADQTALYKAQHAPHPDPVEIKRLQDLIAQLKITLQQYKDQYNALLLKYAQLLQSEGLAGAADLDRLVTNINKKFQEITTQAGDLDKHIKKIVQTVTNKYAATKDALTKQVKALGDRADALDKQIKDELGKIKSGVKAQSLLQITQDVQNWFQTLTTEIPALQTKFENTLKGNFSDFLSDPVDQAVNDINKIIVNLKTSIHTVPIVDADGSPILDATNTAIQYDLSPVFADYFDSVISDVKLAFFDFSYRYVRALKDFDTELLLTIQGFRKSFVDGVLQKLDDLHNNEKLLKNAIYTYRNKIGYAVNQLQDSADEINGELSALETDFFVLKGELRTIVDGVKPQVIDFFHQYASVPQLKTAQVYISSISKLVNEETSVAIGYAQDYINSQTDLYNLNVEKNATRVFAELKDYSKNQIKGKLRNLSEHFGGMINPEIPVDFLSYLRDPRKIEDQVIANLPDSVKAGIATSKKVVEGLKNQVAATRQEITNAVGAGEQQLQALNNKLKQQLDDYKNAINASPIVKDLVLIGSEAKSFYDEAKSFSPDSFFKNLEAKLFGTIYLKDILGLDFQLPRLSPSRDEITYNFITNKIQSKDFSFFRFSASDQTQFQIYFSKSLKAAQTYSAFTRLSNFKLIIVLVSEDVLLVKFKEFRVSSDNGNSKQVSVSLDGVAFGGPLDFFGKLAEKLQLPGSACASGPHPVSWKWVTVSRCRASVRRASILQTSNLMSTWSSLMPTVLRFLR